jgi:para-aminobenzoate synthetase component 1
VHCADTLAAALLARIPAEVGAAAVHWGPSTIVGASPVEVVAASGPSAIRHLDGLAPGFWVGWCGFELGHALERVVPRHASREGAVVPDLVFARYSALAIVDSDGRMAVRGEGDGRTLLERAARDLEPTAVAPPLHGGSFRSSIDRDGYRDRIETILTLLEAGECYQVNLTRRLSAERALDPVALYGAIARSHPAPYAAMARFVIDGDAIAVVSASPERFLSVRGRVVETKPIKGTAVTRRTLEHSAKDRAENVMIVDLARNDLGRVCAHGSITVPALCAIEEHPGLHHLVSTVRGHLRDDVGLAALVSATFPPASVTGAPKPRVLQIIEDLEPVRRGVYCGAFGWIDTAHGDADLSVAIRTFTSVGRGDDGCTHLGVGGGVVADSRPDDEWAETELKASRLLAVAGAHEATLVRT